MQKAENFEHVKQETNRFTFFVFLNFAILEIKDISATFDRSYIKIKTKLYIRTARSIR